jgi:hypothetical protein
VQSRRRNTDNFSDIFEKISPTQVPTKSPVVTTTAPDISTIAPSAYPTESPVENIDLPTFLPSNDFPDRQETNFTILPFIHDEGNKLDGTVGPYAVWWQYAPIVPERSIINMDVILSPFSFSTVVLEQHFATMSSIHSYKAKKSTGNGKQATTESFINDLLLKQSNTYTAGDPFGYMTYPIFDRHSDAKRSSASSSVVALLSTTFYWKSYFQNILPEDNVGIVCVISNTMGQIISLQIDAGNVTMLGNEDLHDTNFDYLAISTNLSSGGLLSPKDLEGYTGVPLDEKIILYSISVYPSEAMKEKYTTSIPTYVACAIILCFAFTGIIFCFYDHYVSRRQQMVMDSAIKTNEIVSSLFPETVRDRIMQETMTRAAELHSSDASVKTTAFDAATAIADFYPSATVLCTYLFNMNRHVTMGTNN